MPGISEAFVYGDSLRDYCVAIIVPNPGKFIEICKNMGFEETLETLCQNV